MDILNFLSWIAGKKRVVTSVPDDSLIPVGVRNPQRGDLYTTVGIKKSDLIPEISPLDLGFKPGSIGPKVSFRKSTGKTNRDIIIPGLLEITRGNNGGGIYNAAVESSFNGGISPENTTWNTQYTTDTNTSWSPLWDLENRTFEKWRQASRTPEGSYAPPQYVGMPAVMKYDDGNIVKYYLIMFTEWGVGSYDEYNFAYDRYEILPMIQFNKADYDNTAVSIVSEGVHLKRDNNGALYNAVNEPYFEDGVSPRNTKWNSIYTDSRTDYYGFNDLSNLESRVYTDFVSALDGSVGNNVLNTDLIMWDMTTDLYYKVRFGGWTNNNNGGGFIYRRTVIPQSESVKFADGTVMNTAPVTSGGTTCCPTLDSEGNLIIGDNSANTVNVGPGGTHDIPNFSGFLLVNDHYDGGVETWIAGGGDTICLGATNTGGGPVGSSLAINGTGYTWTNDSNMTGPFTFTVIKTRNEA